jgi:transcription elongation factor Elf1
MNKPYFECPHCGAFYHVSCMKICDRKRASAKCIVCDKVMLTWNSSRVPSFTLVKRVDLDQLADS